MAWAKGTCTDWIDLLRKLRDYATGVLDPATDAEITAGVVVPPLDQWTLLTNGGGQPALPGSGTATDGDLYLQGPLIKAPDGVVQHAVVGFQSYRNATPAYGWRLRGYTQFDATATFSTIANASPQTQVALSNGAINCNFWVNHRRILALASFGGVTTLIHAGYLLRYGTALQWPCPLLVTGSVQAETLAATDTSYYHSCVPDPTVNGGYLYSPENTWLPVTNYSGPTADGFGQRPRFNFAAAPTTHGVWPLVDGSPGDGAEIEIIAEDQMFSTWTAAAPYQLTTAEVGMRQLFQTVLHAHDRFSGELEGVRVVAGESGLAAGDTITVGADTYDVFSNTWKSSLPDFFAVKRA